MKSISRFLLLVLSLVPFQVHATPAPTTLGSNLTAYNPNGNINNNAWNTMMNSRTYMTSSNAPTADFGNCNAVILRCVQPKCATGGCTSMEVVRPIVEGCISSNPTCKEYGSDLVEYISAQMVASSTAKANQQALQAQNEAAAAAAAAAQQQSAQQLQAMQEQVAQLQNQIAQQNEQAQAQLQQALEQQKQLTQQAIADVSANQQPSQTIYVQQPATNSSGSNVEISAETQPQINTGVSSEVLVREQIAGQILSSIENAEDSMKTLKAVLQDTFDYAGCDSSGNNCSGPKRVKVFKDKAMKFFDPYNEVLEELYDALILAQSVGVDITDIYLMLSGTCNVWGQYLCGPGQIMHYNSLNCIGGISVPTGNKNGDVFGGAKCKPGQVVPMSDGGCQPIKTLGSDAEVREAWLYPEKNDNTSVRVGCMSEILDNSPFFSSMKKQANIDVETLQRIIEQDASVSYNLSGTRNTDAPRPEQYCSIGDNAYEDLQKLVNLKQLPKAVCVNQNQIQRNDDWISQTNNEAVNYQALACRQEQQRYNSATEEERKAQRLRTYKQCMCEAALFVSNGPAPMWDGTNCLCYDNNWNISKSYNFNYGTLTCEESSGSSDKQPQNLEDEDKEDTESNE